MILTPQEFCCVSLSFAYPTLRPRIIKKQTTRIKIVTKDARTYRKMNSFFGTATLSQIISVGAGALVTTILYCFGAPSRFETYVVQSLLLSNLWQNVLVLGLVNSKRRYAISFFSKVTKTVPFEVKSRSWLISAFSSLID